MNEGEDVDSLADELRGLVKRFVEDKRDWYLPKMNQARWGVRGVGTALIVISASIPFFAAITFPLQHEALALAGVLVSILAGLNAFYRWDHVWGSHSQTYAALDALVGEWELGMIAARKQATERAVEETMIKVTQDVLARAAGVLREETTSYFRTVQSPTKES